MNIKIFNALIILTWVLFLPLVAAQDCPIAPDLAEDFSVQGPNEVSVYDCVSSDAGFLTITNTGSVPSGYSLSASGSAAHFLSLGPINFILEPGKSQKVLSYLTIPCGAEKEYDLTIYVNTVLETKKEIKQKIIVEKTKNIGITPVVYTQVIKPCEIASYTYNIENTGSFTETYSVLFKEPFGKYAFVNFNQVTLGGGQSIPLNIQFKPDCSLYGNYSIPFSVKTANTGLYAKTLFYVFIDRAYSYKLTLGNAKLSGSNDSSFATHTTDELYSLCKDAQYLIPFSLKNTANISNQYSLNLLDSPKFISLKDGSISLEQNEEKFSYIKINSTGIIGDFVVGLSAESGYGDLVLSKNLSLHFENCYQPEILTKDLDRLRLGYNSTTVPVTIANKGTRDAEFNILIKKGYENISVEPSVLNVRSGATSTFYLVSKPASNAPAGKYNAELIFHAKDMPQTYKYDLPILLNSQGSVFDRLYRNIILPYFWYIFAILILFILLLALLLLALLRRKRAKKLAHTEKREIKKEVKKEARKRISSATKRLIWRWILIILAVLILGGLIWLFWDSIENYTKSYLNQTRSDVNQTSIEESEEVQKESKIYNWISWVYQQIKSFFLLYWLYLLIGFLVLLLLLLLFLLIRYLKNKGFFSRIRQKIKSLVRVRKTSRNVVSEKSFEEREPLKIKLNKKWLFIIFLILLLLILGYLLYLFWTPIADVFSKYYNSTRYVSNETLPNYTEQVDTITTEPEDTNITKEPGYIVKTARKAWNLFLILIPYILYLILALIILLLLFLLFRRWRKRKKVYQLFDHAEKEIVLNHKKKISCGEIILKLKRLVYNVGISLKKTRKQTFIGAGDTVYEYFSIEKENIDEQDISEMIVRFRVKKSWLARKHVRRSDVSLKRYHDRWLGLNTQFLTEDKKYCYYESVMHQPFFGYFAVVGKRTEPKTRTIASSLVTAEKKKSKFNFKNLWWILFAILGLLFAIGLVTLIYLFWAFLVFFFLTYIWFILLGLLIAGLILFFPWIWRLLKKISFGKKLKKILLWILLILLLLLLLSLIGWGLYYLLTHLNLGFDSSQMYVDLSSNKTDSVGEESSQDLVPVIIEPGNQTDNEPEASNVSESNKENLNNDTAGKPPNVVIVKKAEGIPDQEWLENTNLILDLSDYFTDPDDDKLQYTNSELEHISISYENDVATLIPERNWIGSEFVIFTADDLRGGTVDSNIVKLTVKKDDSKKPEPTFLFILSSYRPWPSQNKSIS
jgi:PGF-pre-PGF domain-containing protein